VSHVAGFQVEGDAMDIINLAPISDVIVKTVAQHSLGAAEDFILFLDGAVNAVRANVARAKLEEYRQKG
jgi:hypothetical protein